MPLLMQPLLPPLLLPTLLLLMPLLMPPWLMPPLLVTMLVFDQAARSLRCAKCSSGPPVQLSLRASVGPAGRGSFPPVLRVSVVVATSVGGMERPTRFEHSRFVGDKRTQLVYDLDSWTDVDVIDEIVGSDVGICFGPDTLAEARNRGYTLAEPGMSRRRRKPRA
jgi:hypothetical protein